MYITQRKINLLMLYIVMTPTVEYSGKSKMIDIVKL